MKSFKYSLTLITSYKTTLDYIGDYEYISILINIKTLVENDMKLFEIVD